MLVGIAGKAGAGKDTVAKIISDNNIGGRAWSRLALATPIKEACNGIFGWDDRHSYGELKEVVDPRFGISPRRAYQSLGTEWGRDHVCHDVWLKVAEVRMQEHQNTLITDLRFENEVQWLRDRGGKILMIDRVTSEVGISGHSSEKGVAHLLDHEKDLIIVNSYQSVPALGEFLLGSSAFHKWLRE